jgi:hypothetical protein
MLQQYLVQIVLEMAHMQVQGLLMLLLLAVHLGHRCCLLKLTHTSYGSSPGALLVAFVLST